MKNNYQKPDLERVQLDQEISLVLLSPPLGPGDENVFEEPFGDPESMVLLP